MIADERRAQKEERDHLRQQRHERRKAREDDGVFESSDESAESELDEWNVKQAYGERDRRMSGTPDPLLDAEGTL
jgi:hypothetical protein